MSALASLLDAGLTLEADGGRLIVTPAARISEPLRALIRANLAELLGQVRDATRLTTETARNAQPDPWLDPDRYCWPFSSAMNTAELCAMERRLALFMGRGIPMLQAEKLADALVLRDRDGDDRKSCAECQHGRSPRCPDGAPLPHGVLHRCGKFSEPSL